MDFDLVVTEPFGAYAVGDRITDAKAIEEALTLNPSHVVRVAKQSAPKAD
jgi:hypothetical protein